MIKKIKKIKKHSTILKNSLNYFQVDWEYIKILFSKY